MVEIIWEIVVRDGFQARFEEAYGPDGDWNNLFNGSTGFQGIKLLQDAKNPRRYLTVDL
jgi:heme-degrading monooxygenase HmoA